MNKTRLSLLGCIIFFTLSMTTYVFAKSKSSKLPDSSNKLYNLLNIEDDSQQTSSIVKITLNKKVNWKSVAMHDHGTFIQIILPDTIVPIPGKFYDVKSPYIHKVAVFQISQRDAGIRLFLNKAADKVKKASSIDILNQYIIYTLDHKKLTDLLANDPAEKALAKKTKASPAVLGALTKAAPTTENKISFLNTSGLKNRLISISIFFIVMIFGLIILFLFKPILLKKDRLKKLNKTSAIKTIATHALAPKQKLALVEVSGEKILLGLSQEGINFLSNIGAKQMPLQYIMTQGQVMPQIASEATNNSKQLLSKYPQTIVKTYKKPLKTKGSVSQKIQQINREVSRDKGASNGFKEKLFESDDTSSVKLKKSIHTSSEDFKDNSKAIDDVTKLIRNKLKNLSSI